MNSILKRTIAILIVVGPGVTAAMGQLAIPWSTVDGGGATSTGGAFTLTGTIGQPDASSASAMTGGNYAATGGFWAVTLPACTSFAPADFNHDCSVDSADFTVFKACATGWGVHYNPAALPPGCTLTPDVNGKIPADLDQDGDVDQGDFGRFQRCYSGNQIANPNCAN